MNDLISRKAVLKLIEDIKVDKDIPKNYGTLLDIMSVIRNMPTAYDVDKVVEQLQQMKTRYFLTIANTGNETLDKIYEDVGNSIDKAIEIMKGAVDDE